MKGFHQCWTSTERGVVCTGMLTSCIPVIKNFPQTYNSFLNRSKCLHECLRVWLSLTQDRRMAVIWNDFQQHSLQGQRDVSNFRFFFFTLKTLHRGSGGSAVGPATDLLQHLPKRHVGSSKTRSDTKPRPADDKNRGQWVKINVQQQLSCVLGTPQINASFSERKQEENGSGVGRSVWWEAVVTWSQHVTSTSISPGRSVKTIVKRGVFSWPKIYG